MKDSVRVREATFDDYPHVFRLMSKYDMNPPPLEQWLHLWKNNPVVIESEPEWSPGWVLEDTKTGEVAGFFGNFPLEYFLNGKKYLAASARDWVVDQAYRKCSPLLSEAFFAQKKPALLFNTSAISSTGRIFISFGGSKVPVPDYDKSQMWITHALGFSNSLLKMKNLPLSDFLKIPLSFAAKSVALFKSQSETKYRASSNFIFLDHFDERFDLFWKKLKKRSPHFLGRRDQKALHWHFKYPLSQNKLWIIAQIAGEEVSAMQNRSGEITSYALFYRQDTPSYELTRMRLVDFQTLHSKAHDEINLNQTLLPLMTLALKKCRSEKIHLLEAVGFDQKTRDALKKLKPIERQLPTWLYYFKALDPNLNQELKYSSHWNPNSYDGDACL